MFNNKNNKKEEIDKEKTAQNQKINLNDLKEVTGGAGLRSAPKTKTTSISRDTKSKI